MTERPIIGFDAKRIVHDGAGLGSYGRTLVNDVGRLGTFLLRLYAPDEGKNEYRSQVVTGPDVSFCYPRHSHTALARVLWRPRGISRQLVADGVQVFHGLSGELPAGLDRRGIRSVVTIHDLIFLRHPEYYNKADVRTYTRKFRQAIQQADRIVAISECTRRDISELGDVDAARIDVVYQSCARRFTEEPDAKLLWQVRGQYDLPDRYVLCVGSIEERKNALLAVQALHHLPDDVSLVLVGRHTPYTDVVTRYALDHRLSQRVVLLHGVPDAHLPALYRMADCFVYPSRYEGFGIPIIEAIRMGLPVVACTGSCLEEAGGPDSLYVGPDDAPAMAHAISRVLYGAPERDRRVSLSREYVSRFDNTGAAQAFANIYRELLSASNE